MATPEYHRTVNKWASRVVPLTLVGVTGYATYVIVTVCIYDVFRDPARLPISKGGAAAVLVLYFILLPLFLLPYVRIFQVVHTNPGYTRQRPKAKQERRRNEEKADRELFQRSCVRTTVPDPPATPSTGGRDHRRSRARRHSSIDHRSILNGTTTPPPGLHDFTSREVFVCDSRGFPIWCSICNNWKPDRTHHCSEVGRCVRRMDHFCPWVGGVVSETNMKFFIQFVCYAAIFNLFVMIVMAVAVAERKNSRELHGADSNWIAILVLSAVFFFFSVGMAGSTIQLALKNLTTIENLNRTSQVYHLAVHVKTPESYFHTITYQSSGPPVTRPPLTPVEGLTEPANAPSVNASTVLPSDSPNARSYAILRTDPGDNPWDIGPLANLRSILGDKWHDWLLPFKYSPVCRHHRGDDSEFPFGPVVEELKAAAGIRSARSCT